MYLSAFFHTPPPKIFRKYELVKNCLLPVFEVTDFRCSRVISSLFVISLYLFLIYVFFPISQWKCSRNTVRFRSRDAAVDSYHESAHPFLNPHLRLSFRLNVEIHPLIFRIDWHLPFKTCSSLNRPIFRLGCATLRCIVP
jgi:hypothetical protein